MTTDDFTPPAGQATPSHRAGLRDRLAAALYERERPPRDPHWPKAFAADREVFEAMADAVLAVLYREWPWLRAEAEDAAPAEAADRDRIAAAALAAVETALRDTLTADARAEALAGITAVLPAPADRAAVLHEAADTIAAHPGPIPWLPGLPKGEAEGFWWDTRDRDAAADLLRRMADETATTETQLGAAVAEADAERLATLTDCPNSRAGGLHCGHYQEGDGPCCNCKRPNWCPNGGVA